MEEGGGGRQQRADVDPATAKLRCCVTYNRMNRARGHDGRFMLRERNEMIVQSKEREK